MQGTPAGLSWRDKGYPGRLHALLVGSFGVRERLGSPAHSSLSQSSGVLSAALPTPRMVPSCLAWPQRDVLLGTWGRHGHNHRSPELSPSCGGQPGWLTRWSQCARTTLVDQAGRPKYSFNDPETLQRARTQCAQGGHRGGPDMSHPRKHMPQGHDGCTLWIHA